MSLPPRTQQPARAVPYSIPPPRLAYRTSPYPSSFPFPSTQQQQQQQQQQPATPTPSTLSTFSPAQAAPPLSTGMVAPPSTSTSYFRPGTIFPASFPPLTPPTAGVLPVSVSSNHFPAANYAYQSSQQLNSQLASPLSSMSALAHSILPSSALGLPQDSHHSTCSSSSAPTSPDLTEDRLSHKEFSPQTPNDGVSLQDPIPHFPSSSYTSPPHTMFPGPVYTPPEYHSAMTSNHPSCLPPMPLCNWNAVPYPPLGSLGVPPPPPSIPKLSYDSPRFKLTPERAIPLIKWFEEHKDHPYPTRHEKMLLCQSTQLTFTQVSTWFANARRRMKKANSDEERGTGSPEDSSSTGSNSPLSSEAAEPGKGLASDTEH